MTLPAADELLAPVMAIDGFRLACLVDGSTGMVLASLENKAGPAPQPAAAGATAAAGAADVINVLAQLNGRLATGENLEDVMVTLSDSFFMVRPVVAHQANQANQANQVDRANKADQANQADQADQADQAPQILLLVIADRRRTNLAMAHRSIRDFCASFTA